MNRAIVVLSGGQDSTTCLHWAIRKFGREAVESITFDYGQRHRIEIECAKKIADLAEVQNVTLPIDTLASLSGNALTDAAIQVKSELDPATSLPNTFVPGRNVIFLTYAAAYGYQRDINNLVTGVTQTDYSGYPDCREQTIVSLQETIRLAMEFPELKIHTPLMHLSKSETVLLARELGALEAMGHTHTCYNGSRPPCGTCPACVIRANGFLEAGIGDPLLTGTIQ